MYDYNEVANRILKDEYLEKFSIYKKSTYR